MTKTSSFAARHQMIACVRVTALASISIVLMLSGQASFAQSPVESRVYNWSELEPVQDEQRIRRQVIEGSTGSLASLTVHASTLQPGLKPHASHSHQDEEELIIISEGSLKVTIKDKSRVLSAGSIAYIMPGEEHGWENTGSTPAVYYILKFKAKAPIDLDRAAKAGGSVMLDWNEITFNKSERGGRRNVIDRATSMFTRFEMHVTTLNQGLSSHAPHTHPAEEMIIIRHGQASMEIDKSHQPAHPAAVVFLGSKVPHALTNVGNGATEYYAFQWE